MGIAGRNRHPRNHRSSGGRRGGRRGSNGAEKFLEYIFVMFAALFTHLIFFHKSAKVNLGAFIGLILILCAFAYGLIPVAIAVALIGLIILICVSVGKAVSGSGKKTDSKKVPDPKLTAGVPEKNSLKGEVSEQPAAEPESGTTEMVGHVPYYTSVHEATSEKNVPDKRGRVFVIQMPDFTEEAFPALVWREGDDILLLPMIHGEEPRRWKCPKKSEIRYKKLKEYEAPVNLFAYENIPLVEEFSAVMPV